MKHSIKLFAITLLLSLVACSESDQENSDQIAKKETDVISIDGTKYSLTFTENKEGNSTLDKGQEEKEKIIADYFKTNLTASSYYNETDKVLYLFKDSETMINFMTKNSKQSLLASKKSNTSKITSLPSVKIELELYADPNFANLLNPIDNENLYLENAGCFITDSGWRADSPLTSGSKTINGSHTSRGFEVPNLANFKAYNIGGSYLNIEDRLSSVKLKVGSQNGPPLIPSNFHQVTAVFYEHTNFGGYSFGMTLNTYNSETSHNNLGTLRMYKSWINGSKYFDNRISSYIINAN
jgi:hypothetical protein